MTTTRCLALCAALALVASTGCAPATCGCNVRAESSSTKPLLWDSHGYYEIALDAGALTLAP
jgi:hypothetical protein